MSGARLMTTLVRLKRRRRGQPVRCSLATLCVGVGRAATIVELD
jgi:acetyl-CoA acetyltransferase